MPNFVDCAHGEQREILRAQQLKLSISGKDYKLKKKRCSNVFPHIETCTYYSRLTKNEPVKPHTGILKNTWGETLYNNVWKLCQFSGGISCESF